MENRRWRKARGKWQGPETSQEVDHIVSVVPEVAASWQEFAKRIGFEGREGELILFIEKATWDALLGVL